MTSVVGRFDGHGSAPGRYRWHCPMQHVQEDTGFGGKRGETIRGNQNVPQCELRSFLVIGEVEKINGVLYKLLRLVRSFLVIGEEEKIICTVWTL